MCSGSRTFRAGTYRAPLGYKARRIPNLRSHMARPRIRNSPLRPNRRSGRRRLTGAQTYRLE